jgi:hypothetical protein
MWGQRLESNRPEVTVNNRGFVLGLFGLALAVAGPAAADLCPYPQPQYATCDEGSCQSSFTFHYCTWYALQEDTCGSYCSPDVICCGTIVDKEKGPCNQLCVGCQPGAKVAMETPKKGKSKKAALRSEPAAKQKATTPVAKQGTAPVVSGASGEGQ